MYNVDSSKLDSKLQRGALISVLHPEAKVVVFQGFNYTTVQLFEPTKLRVNDVWLSKEEFSPA